MNEYFILKHRGKTPSPYANVSCRFCHWPYEVGQVHCCERRAQAASLVRKYNPSHAKSYAAAYLTARSLYPQPRKEWY